MGVKWIITLLRFVPYVIGAVHAVEAVADARKGKDKQDAAVDAAKAALAAAEGAAGRDLLNDADVEKATRGLIDAYVGLLNIVNAKRAAGVLLLLLAVSTPAFAQSGFKQSGCTTTTANVTVTTTTEAVAVSSPVVQLPADSGDVIVFGWAQLTTGADTTTVIPMIRRGTAITDTAVTESNAEAVKAAAGSTEPFYALARETRGASSVQYSFTVKQASATADGTVLQAGICVLVR